MDRILDNITRVDQISLKYVNDFIAGLQELDTAVSFGVQIATLVIGLLICFLGLKLYKVWSGVECLGIGMTLGLGISILLGLSGSAVIIVIVLAAILLAVLGIIFSRFGMLVVCFLAGFSVGSQFMLLSVPVGLIIGVAAGLITGILAAVFKGPVVIIMTALQGGVIAGGAVMNLVGLNGYLFTVIAAAVLAAGGMILQFMMKSREIGKKQVVQANTIKEEVSMESEVEAARSILEEDLEEE